jgi:ubiquinone/menaquinone biosynthesis C-methylase UbiE
MTVMDIGCGVGFFTIPMAEIIGKQGKVIAVDLQPEMLAGLEKTARKTNVDNITLHQCASDSLNIGQWDGTVNFVLIMMMLHEVPDPDRLIREVYCAVAPGGKLLFSEPIGHVNNEKFQSSVDMIQKTGFSIVATPKVRICHSAVFQKEGNQTCALPSMTLAAILLRTTYWKHLPG